MSKEVAEDVEKKREKKEKGGREKGQMGEKEEDEEEREMEEKDKKSRRKRRMKRSERRKNSGNLWTHLGEEKEKPMKSWRGRAELDSMHAPVNPARPQLSITPASPATWVPPLASPEGSCRLER
ncbi:hypothetical protein PoB_000774700 [Plakobranchus ocellatus]|uniref:Uncharacterized protein n=1 Tax=Plakobranchus ocellatus TaxID=259542 RepID=A0AAV3YEF4_9GAST|nr:hypothetical protein PoB_000774700 [Plakobranchus ocellatus]